jgi:phosphoribosylaminoimidazole carboxylase PurE protein
MKVCVDELARFGVEADVRILSAHRTPGSLASFAAGAAQQGIKVIIAGAGMAAALPGAIAAHTSLPVVGVPLARGPLVGVDALLAISQMPPGVPVAAVAIGEPGARNAAILAVQILALSDQVLAEKLRENKRFMAERADKSNQVLRSDLAGR